MTSYGKFDEYVKMAVNSSKDASEVVAISFYKILRKNGFNDNQIINVANNILDCLIRTLESYKERTAETAAHPPGEPVRRDRASEGREPSVPEDTDTPAPL